MITDRQVKRLMAHLHSGKPLSAAADKADMDAKTARKYRELGRLRQDFGLEPFSTPRAQIGPLKVLEGCERGPEIADTLHV